MQTQLVRGRSDRAAVSPIRPDLTAQLGQSQVPLDPAMFTDGSAGWHGQAEVCLLVRGRQVRALATVTVAVEG
jgi:hypothetical protein